MCNLLTCNLPSAIWELIPILGSVDVALGSGCPEDGSNILHLPFGMGTHCPGKRPPGKETLDHYKSHFQANKKQGPTSKHFETAQLLMKILTNLVRNLYLLQVFVTNSQAYETNRTHSNIFHWTQWNQYFYTGKVIQMEGKVSVLTKWHFKSNSNQKIIPAQMPLLGSLKVPATTQAWWQLWPYFLGPAKSTPTSTRKFPDI